jgi:hypothetical protein
LERLFAFSAEHWIVIPRLCFAALSFVFTWDNRAECWFTFLLTATLFLLICRAALPEKQSRSFWVAVALLATSLMLFHTNQWQNWLWGIMVAWPLPVLSLVIAVVVIAGSNRPGPRVAATVAASVVAMLSLGNGFLVPLVIGSIAAYEHLFSRRQRSILEIGVAAALALGGATFSLIQPHPPQSAGNPAGLFRGISLMIANPFFDWSRGATPADLSEITAWGAGLSILFLCAFSALLWLGTSEKPSSSTLYQIGLALAALGALSVAMIVVARRQLGLDWLLQSRYITYSVLLPVGLTLMAAALAESSRSRAAIAFCRGWIVAGLLLALVSLRGEPGRLQWGRAMKAVYATLFDELKVSAVFPQADLARVIPQANRAELITRAARDRLIKGMAPPGRRVEAGNVMLNQRIGTVTDVQINGAGLEISGSVARDSGDLRADTKFVGRLNADGAVDLLAPILQSGLIASGATNSWSVDVTTADRSYAVVIIAYDWRKRMFFRSLPVQVGPLPQVPQ